MTSTDTFTPQVPPDDGQAARRKSRLFCPACGHESVADWRVSDGADGDRDGTGREFRCPRCDTVVATH